MEQANMMPGGMPGQGNPNMNANSMQRPQPGNFAQQLHGKISEELRRSAPSLGAGWQAMLDYRERANRIMQLITQLRLINSDVGKCFGIAVAWELKVIQASANKEQYLEQMAIKMKEISAKRQQAATHMSMPGNMNGSMGMMPNNMMNMQNSMMNMPNMQVNGMGNMNFPNGGNMGMQGGRMPQNHNQMAQLQRQMQASPLPMQQQQQQQPSTLDPSALRMPPQGNQQHSQQPGSQHGQNMGQPNQPPQVNMTQGGQGRPNQAFQQEIIQLAKQMADKMSPQQKVEMRAKVTASMTEEQKAQLQQQGADPLMKLLYSRAQNEVFKRRQTGAMQNKPDMGNGNGNLNMQMGNNVPQRPPSQTNGQAIDFNSIMGQQANALKLQDAGEQVVPASNNNSGNNNNLGMGNPMNMPQNINPQMLGNNNNQGQQGGNASMNPQMQQILMMQRASQNKQLMAQQHAMAARQQHSQLQGQPGGLHTPNGFGSGANGQVNSPAMSMLNRPMAPPGQTTPGTPQPNRQQPMPPTPMNNGVGQLQQHHQNMLNQNNQQQQMNAAAPNNGVNFQDILARVPPQFRSKLGQMPPDQARLMLQRFHNQAMLRQQGQQNPQNPQGMPNNMPNGMNMGPPQHSNQQQLSMPPQNMGNAIPGFNSQPPPDQMNMDPAAQLQQRIQREQHVKLRAQAMDIRPFPKPVLTQLGIAVPPHVQLWGHLKQHVMQHSPQGTIEKVNHQQSLWFQTHPEEFQAAMTAMMQKVRMGSASQPGQQGPPAQNQHQAQQNGAAVQPPATVPDRPAPPAQMVPPAPMMQPQGQGMQPGANRPMPPMPQISSQELAMFRSKVPQAGNMSDEQIRIVLSRQKLDKMKQQQQLQRQSLQTAQMQKPPGQAGVGQQAPSAGMGMQQQRTPQPPAAQANMGQQVIQQQSHDVVDLSGPPMSQTASQAPPMQASQSQNQAQQPQQSFKPLTKEQVQQLSEQDRQTYLHRMSRQMQLENMRKAQAQLGAANGQAGQQQRPQIPQANAEKLKRIQTEVQSTFQKGKHVQCDNATMEKAKIMLKKLHNPLNQIAHTFGAALNLNFEEEVLKRLMRAMMIVQSNAMDSTGNINGYLSVTLEELTDIERLVAGYMTELKRRKQQNDTARQQAMQAQGMKPQQGTPPAGMARTASQPNHVRKASANAKAPPAPTENKTFDWAAPSPHGVPKYEPGRNELTPDKLKFPPQKKRKTDQAGSQASTPAAQAGTPAAAAGASPALANGKAQSPDQNRKTAAQVKAEAEGAAEQTKIFCTDGTCDASLHGFDTEDQLKQHHELQHQPIEDPLQFLLDNAAAALGIDENGQTLRRVDSATSKGKAKATQKGKEDPQKQQGPSATTGKQGDAQDAMNEEDWIGPLMWPSEMDEHGMFSATPYELGKMLEEGWVEDPNQSGLFHLRPGAMDHDSSPDLTPSEASQSSLNSDVSQNDTVKLNLWLQNMDADLLGNGPQGVPEGMMPLFEQMENINMMKDCEDTHMANTDDNKSDEEGLSKKRKAAPEMWQPPVADFMHSFFEDATV